MSSFTALSAISMKDTPEEFIQELIKMKANVRIYEFMLELKSRFFPEINMILYEDLSQYVGREKEFCIDARMFYKYSKLFVDGYEFDLATADPKSDIKRVLKSSNMKKDKDFNLRIDAEVRKDRGFVNANRYMMTPDSFYLLLMDIPDRYRQARQTFCKYHAFMTKIIKYYDDFQLGLAKLIDDERQQLLAVKDTKIDEQSNKIDNLMDEIKKQAEESKSRDEKQSFQIKELLGLAKEQRVEISEARQDIQDGNTIIEQLNETVGECREVIVERMDAHTINPKSTTKKQYFMCLQHPEHSDILYVIRSQKSNIRKQLKAHSDWNVLIEPIEDPNSIKMFNRFKDRVNQITQDAKFVWNQQWKAKQITRDEYFANVNDLLSHPVISIKRNDVEFDSDQISLKRVLGMMKDTTYERFTLSIP